MARLGKAVIFDFDGTLADSMPLIRRILAGYAPKYNLPQPDERMLQEWRSMTLQDFMARYGLSWLQVSRILWDLRRDMQAELLDVPPVRGIGEVLGALQGKSEVYLLSSNSPGNLAMWVQKHLPEVRFRGITGGVSLTGKAGSLLRLKRELGFEGAQVVYVGDEVRDIRAARKAGVKAAAVTWGMQTRERLVAEAPDALVDEPVGLLRLP